MKFFESSVGIDRCTTPIEINLAKAFSNISRFEYRSVDAHYWEIGRWPGSPCVRIVVASVEIFK